MNGFEIRNKFIGEAALRIVTNCPIGHFTDMTQVWKMATRLWQAMPAEYMEAVEFQVRAEKNK